MNPVIDDYQSEINKYIMDKFQKGEVPGYFLKYCIERYLDVRKEGPKSPMDLMDLAFHYAEKLKKLK